MKNYFKSSRQISFKMFLEKKEDDVADENAERNDMEDNCYDYRNNYD